MAHLLGGTARSSDTGCVAKVAVDTDEIRGHAEGSHVLNDDVTGALAGVVGAVTAGAV